MQTQEKQTVSKVKRSGTYVIQKSQIIGPDGGVANFNKPDMGSKSGQRR